MFKNPISTSNLFATPETKEDLQAYLAQFSGSEATLAYTIAGMTINFASKIVDEAIIEQSK